MAYWCGLSVVVIVGVMCLVIALAMIRRRMVPQAMGRMLPFGLTSGMIRAEAIAFRVDGSTRAIARYVRTLDKRWRACGLVATTP